MPAFPTATEVLARTAERYASLDSYRDEGEQTTIFVADTGPGKRRTTKRIFRTAFIRPDRFFWEYRETDIGPASEWTRGVVWVNSEGVHKWWTIHLPTPPASLSEALGGFAGVSGQTSSRIPKLLMPGLEEFSTLPLPASVARMDQVQLDGVARYRIEGQAHERVASSVAWIECSTLLVRRMDEVMEFNEAKRREMFEQTRRHFATAAADSPHRDMILKGMQDMEARPSPAFTTETTTIWRAQSNCTINSAVFEFRPPEGA